MTGHTHEFSHLVRADTIGATPHAISFEADARALGLLAKRFGVLSVDSLKGEGTLTRQSDGLTILLKGHLKAEVTQACVATLEPVPEKIAENFQAYFLDESQVTSFAKAKKKKDEEEGDLMVPLEEMDERPIPEDHEDPEPVVGGQIDIGEIVAQHLSLALNPYPRSPGAMEKAEIPQEAAQKAPSPFAALKDLIGKKG